MELADALAFLTPVGLPFKPGMLENMESLGAKVGEGLRSDGLHFYAIEWRDNIYTNGIAPSDKFDWKKVQAWSIAVLWHTIKTNAGIDAGTRPSFD